MNVTIAVLLFVGGIIVGLFIPFLIKLFNFQFLSDVREAMVHRLAALKGAFGRLFRSIAGDSTINNPVLQSVDPREQQINDSAQEIRTILLSLATLLQRADQVASRSSSTLGNVRMNIEGPFLMKDLQQVHDLLITEIDRVISSNNDLKKELARSQESLEIQRQQIESLKTAVRVDGLTQLANRVYFDEKLVEMIALQNRYADSFSLLMIDVDNFKQINDSLGHQAGDRFLRKIAIKLKASVRESDFIARYGGDEFALILPKTKADAAGELGKKICRLLEESRFLLEGKEFSLTLSIGVAETVPEDTPETLVKRADSGLYQAKVEGRNRAIIAVLPHESSPQSPRVRV